MIEEIVIVRDVTDENAENWDKMALAVNVLIRKVNVLCRIMDRKYVSNEDQRVLGECIDPNR